MDITELQKRIVEMLNADQELRAGGCKAIAEDALDLLTEIERHLGEVGGVVAIASPGDGARAGSNTGDGIPCAHSAFTLNFSEQVSTNRARPGAITAQQAAMRAIALLDCPQFLYDRHTAVPNEEDGAITISVYFKTTAYIKSTEATTKQKTQE